MSCTFQGPLPALHRASNTKSRVNDTCFILSSEPKGASQIHFSALMKPTNLPYHHCLSVEIDFLPLCAAHPQTDTQVSLSDHQQNTWALVLGDPASPFTVHTPETWRLCPPTTPLLPTPEHARSEQPRRWDSPPCLRERGFLRRHVILSPLRYIKYACILKNGL